tara:strand:+ start:2373 stop:3650 length:1278 start_codon:yes stop_codon:yes gene_type:complete
MSVIKSIKGREVFDSRGNPTVECEIKLENGISGRASVPSGASKGKHEALELRDNDLKRFKGKGVLKAVKNINEIISKKLIGFDILDQLKIDQTLISIDNTDDKSNLGANSILSVSLASAKVASIFQNLFLYEYLAKNNKKILPVPLMNIINGGIHADNNIDIQEFMIAPIGAKSFSESMEICFNIFNNLKSLLKKKGLNTNVGDEGGFAPDLKNSNQVIDFILEASIKSGYKVGSEVFLALDVASTELYKNNKYNLYGENKSLNSEKMATYLSNLADEYPIFSIEDGMSEDDFDGWNLLTSMIGKKVQLVGDDLFVTNPKRLEEGIKKNIANSVLIKPNQIGTISETLNVVDLAFKNNYSCIMSHRSGETEDSTIADISVAFNINQIKAGSLTRSDRLSKYNQLLRIEENLGNKSIYAGKNILKF